MGLEYAEEHERVFNDTVNSQRTFLCKKTPVFFSILLLVPPNLD